MIQEAGPVTKQDYFYLARIAEEGERYDEMFDLVIKGIKLDSNLTMSQKNYFSVAYRHSSRQRKHNLRRLYYQQAKQQSKSERNYNLIKQYRKKLQQELLSIYNKTIDVTDNFLLPNCIDQQLLVSYYKIKSDIYQQISSMVTGEARTQAKKKCEKFYKTTEDILNSYISAANPIRLGLALSYSVFTYQIKNDFRLAIKIGQKAFQQGLSALQDLESQQQRRDSRAILQLLRQNLQLWTQELEQQKIIDSTGDKI